MENKNYLSNLKIGGVVYTLKDKELAEEIIGKLERVFVEDLPDVSDAKGNVLYILPSKVYVGYGKYETEYQLYILSDDKTNFIQIGSFDEKFYSKDELKVADNVNDDSSSQPYIVPTNSAVRDYVESKVGIEEGEKVLSYAEGKFASTITLYYNSKDKQIELRGIDNSVIASVPTESIVGSAIVKTAYLTDKDDKTYIVIEFETSDPEGSNVEIDVSKLIDLYNGSNLELSGAYKVPSVYTEPVSGMNMDSAIANLVKKNRFIETRIDQLSLLSSSIPKGIICMWSGTLEEIPKGWHLCDGTNGTPDMRNRFIVGYGSKYGIGDKGGNDSATLSSDNLPPHSHTLKINNGGDYNTRLYTSMNGQHNHSVSLTGGSHEHKYTYYKYQWWDGQSKGNDAAKVRNIQENTLEGTISSSGSHEHTGNTGTISNHQHTIDLVLPSHDHTGTIGNTGNGKSFDNRPLYYAVAYIMNISGSGEKEDNIYLKQVNLNAYEGTYNEIVQHIGETDDKYVNGYVYKLFTKHVEKEPIEEIVEIITEKTYTIPIGYSAVIYSGSDLIPAGVYVFDGATRTEANYYSIFKNISNNTTINWFNVKYFKEVLDKIGEAGVYSSWASQSDGTGYVKVKKYDPETELLYLENGNIYKRTNNYEGTITVYPCHKLNEDGTLGNDEFILHNPGLSQCWIWKVLCYYNNGYAHFVTDYINNYERNYKWKNYTTETTETITEKEYKTILIPQYEDITDWWRIDIQPSGGTVEWEIID